MNAFEAGEKYKIKDQSESYAFSGVSGEFYCGVFISEDGNTHIFEFNDMQKRDLDFKCNEDIVLAKDKRRRIFKKRSINDLG